MIKDRQKEGETMPTPTMIPETRLAQLEAHADEGGTFQAAIVQELIGHIRGMGSKPEQPGNCREAFEREFAGKGYDLRIDNEGNYICYSTRPAYKKFAQGWQAAWSARPKDMQAVREALEAMEAVDKATSDIRMAFPLFCDRDGFVRLTAPLSLINPFMRASAEFCNLVSKARSTCAVLLTTPPAPAQDGWQPIETAPKDGVTIVVAGYLDRRWYFKQTYWRKYSHYNIKSSEGGFACDFHPTHWMPLPQPPKASKGPA